MVAFADGIESAQKQWREKASRVDDQITWWEPTERTFVPFDYPHTQTDEEMGAAAIEQARAMVRIEGPFPTTGLRPREKCDATKSRDSIRCSTGEE